MECVIKIVQGPDEGREFKAATGETVIGRSPRSQIRLSSQTLSYEHAIITRNGNNFFLENLSAGGTFINEERISGKVRLRVRDQIRLGQDTLARVESVPMDSAGSRKKLYAGLFLLLLVLLAAVILIDPFSNSASRNDYHRAYVRLAAFVQQETTTGRLPAQARDLFDAGWRAYDTGDKETAANTYQKLRIAFTSTDLPTLAARHPAALDNMLDPSKNTSPSDDELAAALLQFVTRMTRVR